MLNIQKIIFLAKKGNSKLRRSIRWGEQDLNKPEMCAKIHRIFKLTDLTRLWQKKVSFQCRSARQNCQMSQRADAVCMKEWLYLT